MISYAVLLVSLCFVNGFLLDPTNQQNSGGPNNVPYLTVSEFIDEKQQQQHQLDRKFALLTSQLQQKFTDLEKKMSDLDKSNETLKTDTQCEQKYRELQKKYMELQTKFDTLNAKNVVQKAEISQVRNKTAVLETKISDLENLGNIHPLQDILTLQQKVQSVDAKTNSLSVNQQARNQDFLALYNETLISKRKISDLDTQTNYRINKLQTFQNQTLMKVNNEFDNKIEGLRKFQNMTIDTLNSRIDHLKKEENKTLAALQDKVANNSERVAFTGCVLSGATRPSGYIIRFSSVKHHVGIQHLNDLTSSGKFTCEKEGLYQISTTISSHLSGARYYIYKNGLPVTDRYMSFSGSGSYVHSSSAFVALELNVSDTVWVQTSTSMYVYVDWSCFTVIKVK